jgi:hypothetical protein
MNHWNTSPIGQTNEAAPKYTPKEEDNSNSDDTKQKGVDYKYLLANEDLQKIRRSNHSSHHARREVMDDDEHDGIIKGLLYPRLEDSVNSFDFFEEDYEMAQEAVNNAPSSSSAAAASYPNTSNNNDSYNQPPTLQDNSYYASYYSSMGRPYSDLSSEKLHR